MVVVDKKLALIRKELLERKQELDLLLSQRAHETNDQEAEKIPVIRRYRLLSRF